MKISKLLGLGRRRVPPKILTDEEWREQHNEERVRKFKEEPYGWVIEEQYKNWVWRNQSNHKIYMTEAIAYEALSYISRPLDTNYKYRIYPVFIKMKENDN